MIHKLFFLPCIVLFFTNSFATETSNGFTIDLIHRSNSSQSKWDRLSESLQRSSFRVSRFMNSKASDTNNVQSYILSSGGEYLMNISIGTPPFSLLGIADTGSDLTWTQCKPCIQCYNQNSPIFNPKNSSSYKKLPCESSACHSIGTSNCSMNTCSYHYSYGDKSYTDGDLITETVSFVGSTGSRVSFNDIVIGCGHSNGGTFSENGSGLIGLGGGSLSLVSQLIKLLGGKFAYCLVPFTNTDMSSKMSFGSNAIVSNGSHIVSTPLVKKDPNTFYYLTLESISIGNRVLNYKKTLSGLSAFWKDYCVEKGNIIIDSGTTLTLLPDKFYLELEAALVEVIRGERVDEQQGGMLRLCYRSQGDLEVPTIKVKFEGGEVVLKSYNAFVRIQEDVMCLAMSPSSTIAIFGNLAQMDFLVSYDLEERKVSFEPKDCSKHE